jgi:hypothetical protein
MLRWLLAQQSLAQPMQACYLVVRAYYYNADIFVLEGKREEYRCVHIIVIDAAAILPVSGVEPPLLLHALHLSLYS